MGWILSALLLIWVVPLVLAGCGALLYVFSHAFRRWLVRELFGESPADPHRTIATEHGKNIEGGRPA